MREYVVHMVVRKGLGPYFFNKDVFVGIDDLDPEITEDEIMDMVRADANHQMRSTKDFKLYGHNWAIIEIEET